MTPGKHASEDCGGYADYAAVPCPDPSHLPKLQALSHSCSACCQTLGYLEDVLIFHFERPKEISRWWKIRHPFAWYQIKIRRVHAADLLDEMGK